MKKTTLTEDKAEQTPTGGVLVGKRKGQTIIHNKGTLSGYLVGRTHAKGGIKAINKSTGQPIEVQGGEVIITAPAVADQTKREFEGQMLTNREILSKINEKGGGVSLENGGEIYYNGSSYNYGGKTMTDYEIMQSMNDCGCEHEYDNGGNLNLSKQSKKGDHPARDLNNYNDVLDVEADGMVGSETGLFATGGDLKPYDANMDGDSADTIFKEGGATLSAEVFEWNKVPTNYRNISKVKKVPFTNNPMDKGLDSIISPFLGKDDLRPVGMGINFDKNGITATDYHKLITLPYPNEKYEGIYDINRVKKIKADQPILIDGNYPNYEAIIPKYNVIKPYEINVYKLLQYTKTAMNYANKITRGISFKFGDNDRIGFNGSLLSEVLTASLKLGHEKLYAFITQPNRAMVLSPTKDYEVGSDEILLIMPIMLMTASGVGSGLNLPYGAEDVDYNRSLKAYFDFNDSEIHNADGSVAEFKMQYENNQLVDDNYLALLSKMTSKKVYLPILQYVKVESGKMTATDLEISLVVKNVNMPNGIYEIVNKAPNITMNPIEDFPSERIFNKDEYEKHRQEKRQTAFEFVTFSEVFEFYLDKLLLSVGKDDLRPVMSGICIKKTAQNEMFLVTTDAHTLCKINITEYCEFDKDSRELEYILPVKYLKDFVKLADGSLHFKCSNANIFIESDNLEFIGRTIDGKYPNYDAVIPRESTKAIVFDHVVMNKCLKSQEMTNLVSKYKGQKDILFDFFNIEDTLNVKVSESKSYNVQSDLIETIELCKIDLNYKEVENNLSLDQSVFLLMPSKDNFKENQYFSFRKEFFDTMLETITDTEVECYFTEPNRPYVFPIDAIDYKKTLPVEKTKQQKLSKKDLEQIVELEDLKDVLEPIADEEQNMDKRVADLISILKSKYNTGESLKSLYDQVKEAYGSANVGTIFSTFASEMKNNKKFMEEFNKTSFVDNVVIKSEPNELQEAIETLEMLMQTAKGKDKKEIKEALEIIKMLNENN
jgi:DNA polymerase III sliding clamp (beta) subunit (PCNA family)